MGEWRVGLFGNGQSITAHITSQIINSLIYISKIVAKCYKF